MLYIGPVSKVSVYILPSFCKFSKYRTPRGPSDYFGSKILAKSDIFGSMKDTAIFLGHKKTEGYFWIAKKVVSLLGRQIWKL